MRGRRLENLSCAWRSVILCMRVHADGCDCSSQRRWHASERACALFGQVDTAWCGNDARKRGRESDRGAGSATFFRLYFGQHEKPQSRPKLTHRCTYSTLWQLLAGCLQQPTQYKYKASCSAPCPHVVGSQRSYSKGILFLPEGFFFTHFLALHRCQRNACAAGRRRFCWPKASRLRFARGRTLPVHA